MEETVSTTQYEIFQIVEQNMEPCTHTSTENNQERPSYVTDLRMICVSLLVIAIVSSTIPVGVWAGSGKPLLSRTDACKKLGINCAHGACVNRTDTGPKCVCDKGWKGLSCDSCGGRVKLTQPHGTIIDGYKNYTLDTKCTWLIEAPSPNATIRLRFRHFATECSWDHLYIYNGSSVWDPLLAVFSGLIVLDGSMEKQMPEIVTTGAAYLHFYSDAAYNMSGFTIDYVVGACAKDCSGHGYCNTTNYMCQCHVGWSGKDCSTQLCIHNCSVPHGMCNGYPYSQYCSCSGGYRGDHCSIPPERGVWHRPDKLWNLPHGRTSHQAVVQGQNMAVISGYVLGRKPFQNIVGYDFENNFWTVTEEPKNSPSQRYGHSLVEYKSTASSTLLMYGGVIDGIITNELWEEYDLNNEITWRRILHASGPEPMAVVGHTAHMVGARMYVIFGHSPTYGYVNMVQVFNRGSEKWEIHQSSSGAYVKGGYGHSSVLDENNKKIYIHAGYHSGSASLYKLTDDLYEYQYETNTFKILRASGQPRYLHSAVLLNNLILIFGGNTHNDTSVSHGAKCYSSSFMAYDIRCRTWHVLDAPKLQNDISRFGHTAVEYGGDMYIFGGFNGIVLNDLYKYSPGGCRGFGYDECLRSREGIRCAWVNHERCETEIDAQNLIGLKIVESIEEPICPTPVDDPGRCEFFKTCPSCVGNVYNCKWCKGGCHRLCEDPFWPDLESCKNSTSNSACPLLHNCQSCLDDDNCTWTIHDRKCVNVPPQQSHDAAAHDRPMCQAACYTHNQCENCTSSGCMWCSNEQRCVESNSYVASFPYGQCREWTTMKGRCPATRCEELRTCEDCQSNPACGWCDDSSNTGLGTCLQGGQLAPLPSSTAKCAAPHWFFTECPLCQCNGHSKCFAGTDQCIACTNNTAGDHCETCRPGFWGNPTNGGSCQPCDCNGQADVCKQDSGNCFCHTKGVTGDQCDICEEKHYGDPSNGGTCFYELSTNYQFTFTLSSEEKYLTRINFLNTPKNYVKQAGDIDSANLLVFCVEYLPFTISILTSSHRVHVLQPDRNVDFAINCSSVASLTMTVKAKGSSDPEQIIRENYTCLLFKDKFQHTNFQFGGDSNLTFFVYVFDFKTPFQVTISFSQIEPIDLVHFFVTFFSCFLSLLLLAAVVWKVKQKYDLYRRRQRMHVEMEQMASRPFAMCAVEVSPPNETLMSPKTQQEYEAHRRMKYAVSYPSFVTYEPLACNKAAVLSLVVKLPTGDEDYTPAGQSGLIFGSTLVTFGNPRKASLEQKDRAKYRKQAHEQITPENCV